MSTILAGRPAVVFFSGGQDSTTALFWALHTFGQVAALSFDYQQTHRRELEAAGQLARAIGVQQEVVPIDSLNHVTTGRLLTGAGSDDVVVPGRNLLFLVLAAAYAHRLGSEHLVAGFCGTDRADFPDCRSETVAAMEAALTLGLDRPITVHTPFMWLSKADTVRLARTFPGCWDALGHTVTCYEGQEVPCGRCQACRERAAGFRAAGEEDPLLRRVGQPADPANVQGRDLPERAPS